MATLQKISSGTKWLLALITAAVFLLFSLPYTYDLTNLVVSLTGMETTVGGGPTVYGLILHTLVVFLVVRLILVFF